MLAALLCLSACGSGDPVCGRYRCLGVETEELFVPAHSLGEKPAELNLAPDGRGTLTWGGVEGSLTWTRTGESLSLTADGVEYTAVLREDGIDLELEPGLILRFARADEAAEAPDEPGVWEWYGWWSTEGSTGQMPDTWADCCARLEDGDYGPVLTLWDETTSFDEPLARVQMRWENGEASSESGWFLLGGIGEGSWRLTPGESVNLEGFYTGEGESFSFRIHLLPWGAAWGEEELRLPLYYRAWYLPLLEKGSAMPDRIG